MAGIKKKVDVVCYRPFKLGIANFSGSCNNITLDADSIKICLENKAMVSEVLKNGKRVPLDFSNFNKKNPMGYDIDSAFTDIMGPRTFTVSSINKKGNQIATIKMNDDQPPVIIQNGSVGIAKNLDIMPKEIQAIKPPEEKKEETPNVNPANVITVAGAGSEKEDNKDKKDDKKNQNNNNNKHHK
jgi:hypothetical protein